MSTQLIAELRRALPDGVLVDDPDILAGYRRDEADLCPAGTPAVLTRPRSTAQVATIVRIAAAHRTPIVAQGARTGLAGGANAVDGCVVVCTEAMTAILDIDPVNRTAVVQPGVINADISAAAAAYGLGYPPDPGSWRTSTIGGNVATNAGGMCCVKYGVTSEYVLGLEVVLADARVLRCGRRTRKGVAGYDLTHLFVGSEGTLGIITEITLALRPVPAGRLALVASFDDTVRAGAAVTAMAAAGTTPSLLELIDRVHLEAIEGHSRMGLPAAAAALLLVAVDTGAQAPEDLAGLAQLCREAGAAQLHVATDATEAEALLEARRLAHPAMEALAAATYPAGGLIIDDIAVPVSRLAELLDGVARIAAAHSAVVGLVGHAGDGNMHPNIVIDQADQRSLDRGHRIFDEIMELGLSLGGTCTGEHGVGLLKRGWLHRELGPVGVAVHRAIKHALDPDNLLNPGKAL